MIGVRRIAQDDGEGQSRRVAQGRHSRAIGVGLLEPFELPDAERDQDREGYGGRDRQAKGEPLGRSRRGSFSQ